MCCNDTYTGDSIPELLLGGLVILVVYTTKAAWWLTTKIVGPLALIAAVLAYRWLTGAPLVEQYDAKPQMLTRRVRATGRMLLTGTLVGTLIDPVATAVAAIATTVVATATMILLRRRAGQLRAPRRVQIVVGACVRNPRRTQPAITADWPDRTWTEQTVSGARRTA